MSTSVWAKLSAIDCSAHVDRKGQFSYLSWTWAFAMAKEHYPEASYTVDDDVVYPDGTMEVRCTVTIEGLSHQMWLPVLDFKNRAVSGPNAFDINSSRMRVLTKCLAMFGLGHYIYAGESTPQEAAPDISAEVDALNKSETLDQLREAFKRAWALFPNSRADLTKVKDAKKKELTDD